MRGGRLPRPERLAGVWSAVLKQPIKERRGPYFLLDAPPALPTVVFQRVPEPKTGTNRVHRDLIADDVNAAAVQIIAAGGTREDGGFMVMADPEGNEFCVLPAGAWEMDADGLARGW